MKWKYKLLGIHATILYAVGYFLIGSLPHLNRTFSVVFSASMAIAWLMVMMSNIDEDDKRRNK